MNNGHNNSAESKSWSSQPVDALMALVRAFSNCSPGDEDEALEEIEASARALAAIPAKRCPYCDDTGDVHSIDGEWRGRCTCPAGQYAPTPPTAPAQDVQGERNAQMLIDIGNAALRAGWNGVDLQAFVIGRLASPSPSAVQPLSEAQIEDLHSEANRGFFIEKEDYFKAFRDAERAHGIVTKEST